MIGNRARQSKYIAAHVACGGVKLKACEQAGIDRSTLYKWLDQDKIFQKNLKNAEDRLYESLVAAGLQRAGLKSDILLMFFLKARFPEIYDDNYRKVQWEKKAEAELRELHPLPQILVQPMLKPDEPRK